MYWFDPDVTNQTWFDYPNLGFNKNWISVGGIQRNSSFEAVDFVVFAIDKVAAMNGEDAPVVSRFTTQLGSAIVPAFTYDPDVEELYLVSTGDGNDDGYGYVNLFELSGTPGDPDFELLGSIGVPEPWENWSYENHGDFLPQKGSPNKLNSVDARMHTMIYRNEKLWAVHHIYLPADEPERTSIQWWQLDTDGTLLERGRIDDPDGGMSFAYPSIAVNANEDILIGHGVFSLDQYAGAGYSFKAYYDDSAAIRNYYQYKEGEAPYYKTYGGGRNRWGDYSAVFVDPLQDVNFWAMHEFADLPQNQWGTYWAYLTPSFPPAADFQADNELIPVGESVDFSDLTLGIPTSWAWSFPGGDPGTSTEQNPTGILFDTEGTFDVQLIVSNELGTDTILKPGYITTSTTILPEVAFDVDKTIICSGDVVQFTDQTDYSPIQWEWSFDPPSVTFMNGTSASSQHPEVMFDNADKYDVTLTSWNLNGSAELTKTELILSGGYEPYFKETFEPVTFNSEEWQIVNPDNDVKVP
ncbi:MAG: PKD domain-containing protein, partial [bacterium]